MSWIQKLYETSCNIENLKLSMEDRPWPVSHMAKKAHVEVTIDGKGNFRRSRQLTWNEAVTIIPVTEMSGNRTNADAPHPLCEELSYCAADLPERKDKRFDLMMDLLKKWNSSQWGHPKIKAVIQYLQKRCLYQDLSQSNIFPFRLIGPKGNKTPLENKKVFIRWRIEELGNPCSGTWEDDSLINAWIKFDELQNHPREVTFCMLSAKNVRIAKGHQRFLRAPDDKAKLISSNDSEGFTFRGRFTDGKDDYGKQTCSVGYIESQKAHNALRWLIHRQGYQKNEGEFVRCFVTWAVSCKPIPDPCANSWEFLVAKFQDSKISEVKQADNFGQSFSIRFQKKLAGYKANITDTEEIVVIGLASATPGRMAITFYRELTGSEFLERIEKWHSDFAWMQNYGKNNEDKRMIIFEGAPAPKDIVWCAYGRRSEGKNGIRLLNAAIERLLPSIVDGKHVPYDLVEQCVQRASNRVSFKLDKNGNQPEFEKCLGIACSLFKGFHIKRGYKMALEEERCSRDYLYGRLLAVAEKVESMALYFAREKRETTAARLMQRFADRPYSTWRTIETSLTPYMGRINTKTPGLLIGYKELIDTICCKFNSDEFNQEDRLSGEFLLAYHCQRKWLNEHKREKGQWILKSVEDKENLEADSEEYKIRRKCKWLF